MSQPDFINKQANGVDLVQKNNFLQKLRRGFGNGRLLDYVELVQCNMSNEQGAYVSTGTIYNNSCLQKYLYHLTRLVNTIVAIYKRNGNKMEKKFCITGIIYGCLGEKIKSILKHSDNQIIVYSSICYKIK